MPNYNITGFNQGSTFSLTFRAVSTSGTSINLSGYNLRSSIKEKYSSTGLSSFTSSVLVPESGICNISMTASGASELYSSILLYGVEAYNNDESDVIKLLQGYLTVNPEVVIN